MSEEHGTRLSRVEGEVSGIKQQVTRLETQMRGFGDILQRIEQGVASAQQQWHDDKQSSRLNPIAFAAVLITIITTMVGGAWLIGGELARHDERSAQQEKVIERIEQRLWEVHGHPPAAQP